eukprot:GHVR01086251.1.p1 GENE.GHVR01086251.1~~GHVR01086251.1.p1  ORF type:complete len:190 (-),score=3.94 GHVR01086251.1:6-575(-)
MNSPIMKLMDKSLLLEWYRFRHITEFMPSPAWFTTNLGMLFCSTFKSVCNDLLKLIMDAKPELDNYNRYDVFIGHLPSGTSTTNMAHWKQMVDRKTFQAYDYGSSQKNIEHYGQSTPPKWFISDIRVPLNLFVGNSDELADPKDVQDFWNEVPFEYRKFLKLYNSGHATFVIGLDVSPWMDDLIRMLKE